MERWAPLQHESNSKYAYAIRYSSRLQSEVPKQTVTNKGLKDERAVLHMYFGLHRGDCSHYDLLVDDAVKSGKWIPIFRRNTLPPSSVSNSTS
jgi:hypothetical protein